MKKLVSSLLIGSLAFANIYAENGNSQKAEMPLSFKTTTRTDIQNVAISSDDKKMLVAAKSAVKVFDVKEGELIKVLSFNSTIYKATFSEDNSKIFILTRNYFYIYDASTYKRISYRGAYYCNTFFSKKNFLALLDNDSNHCSLLSVSTGKEIITFNTYNNPVNGAFSPTMKKLAISYDYTVSIYNMNGVLLNSLPKVSSKIIDLKWLDKNRVIIVADNIAYIYNVKTSQLIAKIKNTDGSNTYKIDKIVVLDNNNVLIFDDNKKIRVFNVPKLAFLNKDYLINENANVSDISLSKDGKFLAVVYGNINMKFYDVSKFLNINNQLKLNNVLKNTKSETNSQTNKVEVKKAEIKKVEIKKSQTTPQSVQPKVIIKKEIVEKKVYVQSKTNKKPTVEIYASKTEGIVPLKVDFKFIANDEDGKIVSYYLNFAGKEIMHKGNPSKSFTYTFRNAGKYNIMIAVKDNKGAVATKKITINAREESFDDFQKGMGN